jgi:hypothetical protein
MYRQGRLLLRRQNTAPVGDRCFRRRFVILDAADSIYHERDSITLSAFASPSGWTDKAGNGTAEIRDSFSRMAFEQEAVPQLQKPYNKEIT